VEEVVTEAAGTHPPPQLTILGGHGGARHGLEDGLFAVVAAHVRIVAPGCRILLTREG
jgi:hypothetical protein